MYDFFKSRVLKRPPCISHTHKIGLLPSGAFFGWPATADRSANMPIYVPRARYWLKLTWPHPSAHAAVEPNNKRVILSFSIKLSFSVEILIYDFINIYSKRGNCFLLYERKIFRFNPSNCGMPYILFFNSCKNCIKSCKKHRIKNILGVRFL